MPVCLLTLSCHCCRLLFVARGGTWSPSNHRLWPAAFKASIRTLLLCSNSSEGGKNNTEKLAPAASDGSDGCSDGGDGSSDVCLASLPADALLRIIHLAAAPMSAWL
jgi:hypothetical protein